MKFKKMSNLKINLSFDVLVYIGLLVSFFIISWKNLILGQHYELLTLREIDDLAFQITLRKMHLNIDSSSWSAFFATFDYGYGNLFWAVTSLLTYPFYKMNLDAAVIIIPRQLSILMFLGASIFLYKAIKEYSHQKIIRTILPFLFVLCPALVLAAQRFHNHGYVAFVVLLCFLRIIKMKEYNQTSLAWTSFLMGVAGGIKLVGLLGAPCIPIIWALSSSPKKPWQKGFWSKNQIQSLFMLGISGLGGLILSISPILLLFHWYPAETKHIHETIKYYLEMSKFSSHAAHFADPLYLLQNGLFHYLYPWFVWAASFVGFALAIVQNRGLSQAKIIAIFASILVATSYLLFNTNQGPLSISYYLLPLALLLSLGVVFLLESNQKTFKALTIPFFAFAIYFQTPNALKAINIYSDRMMLDSTKSSIDSFQKTAFLKKFKANSVSILKDYRTAIPISTFNSNARILEAFDNFDIFKNHGPFDLVILHKGSPVFLDETKINDMSNKEQTRISKRLIAKLLQDHKLFETEYQEIFNDDTLIIFQRNKLEPSK